VEVIKIADVLEELVTYSFKKKVGGIQDYIWLPLGEFCD
jgi:hypothetical protein